jgi:hypothetical protein
MGKNLLVHNTFTRLSKAAQLRLHYNILNPVNGIALSQSLGVNGTRAGCWRYGHGIKTRGASGRVTPGLQVNRRRGIQPSTLAGSNGCQGATKGLGTTKPHFDKDNTVRLLHDQVNFAATGTKIFGQQLQTLVCKVFAG